MLENERKAFPVKQSLEIALLLAEQRFNNNKYY